MNVERIRAAVVHLGELTGLAMHVEAESLVAQARPNDATLASLAESELAWRSKRIKLFGQAGMFGEPTWELLLDLFIQSQRGVDVTVTSVCHATSAPLSSALRYLAALQHANYVERRSNAEDRRMQFVSLTDEGRRLVREALISQWELGAGQR